MEAQYKKVYKRAMQGHDNSAQINLVSAHCQSPCYLRALLALFGIIWCSRHLLSVLCPTIWIS